MAGQVQDFRPCCVEDGKPLMATHQSFGDAIWPEAGQRPVPSKSTRMEPLTLDYSHGTIIWRMGQGDMALQEGHQQREAKDDPAAESKRLNVELLVAQERIWLRESVGYLTKSCWFGFLYSAFYFLLKMGVHECSPGWPCPHYIAKDNLEYLIYLLLPPPAP